MFLSKSLCLLPILVVAFSGATSFSQGLTTSSGSISFGYVSLGSRSVRTLTLTNKQASNVTVSQVAADGAGFGVASIGLPVVLASGQRKSVRITFAPQSSGYFTGEISIVSTASNSPATVSLSGTGTTLLLTANPKRLSFGNISVGNSGDEVVTVKNAGSSSITVSQTLVKGKAFTIQGISLPLILAAGQSASISAIFTPTAADKATGSISVVSSASNSPATVSLSGYGVTDQLSASPTSLGFGNVTVGSINTLPIVVTNTGSVSATISQATITGAGFSVSGPGLPMTLAAGQNVSFSVSFDPTAAGNVSDSASVVSNATNSPAIVSLSGVGVNEHSVALSWVASTSPNITGYNVYRGEVSGGPYTLVNSASITATTYVDATVQAGQTYYYVTTAVNSQEVESTDSNQAQANVPVP